LKQLQSVASSRGEFLNSPRVHFMRNALAHAGKMQRRVGRRTAHWLNITHTTRRLFRRGAAGGRCQA
jgi:hypothetical protein